MALAYRPPGTSVNEVITAQVSSILAANALTALVGLSQGYQTRTDQFILSGTSATPLPGKPLGTTVQAVLSVKNAVNTAQGAPDGSGYALTSDYTAQAPAGTITRVGAGAIADNSLVNVTYTYLADDYFVPTLFEDLGSIESRYGQGLNSAGTAINSPISFAAAIAFENGVERIVCQPLLVRGTPGDGTTLASQPNAIQAATPSTWSDSLAQLRNVADVNIVVPIVGQSMTNVTDAVELSILQIVEDHIHYMESEGQYLISVFGEDSSASASVATKTTLRSHAATLRSRYNGYDAEKIVLLNSSQAKRPLPTGGQPLLVGGQYIAAGIAGMIASSPTSSTITRKVLSGFTDLGNEIRGKTEANTDAQAGLCVLETKRGVVQVRHGITIDNTATAKRELSVVRAKHRTIESVYQTMESSIIAKINADETAALTVRNAVSTVLNNLVNARDIVSYDGVQARLLSLDPATIQVRFSYRPAFPVNNIDIVFSLDLSAQSISIN